MYLPWYLDGLRIYQISVFILVAAFLALDKASLILHALKPITCLQQSYYRNHSSSVQIQSSNHSSLFYLKIYYCFGLLIACLRWHCFRYSRG